MWFLAALALVVLPFGLAVTVGAPYVPILQRDYEPLLDLADLAPGQTIVDLGSGDGRFLRAAAKRGLHAIGYEINPVLFLISLFVTWRYRHLVTVRLADFWRQPLPTADAVYVFLLDRFMRDLEILLRREITRPTKVVSFVFPLPHQPLVSRNRNTYLYRFGSSASAHHTAQTSQA
ncbi:MAG TPA: hypothetical protein VLI05_02225 [Candidatus Saccharimonadia bacterium]|nr:hypothetical protein [Candidatus Saccharimonadia bacterium]